MLRRSPKLWDSRGGMYIAISARLGSPCAKCLILTGGCFLPTDNLQGGTCSACPLFTRMRSKLFQKNCGKQPQFFCRTNPNKRRSHNESGISAVSLCPDRSAEHHKSTA